MTHGPSRTFAPALFLLLLAFAMLLGLPSVAFAKKTVGLSSAAFDFNVIAGGAGDGEVIVMNSGDEPIRVLVYTADRRVDEAGNTKFVAPTRDVEYLKSPASWVRLQMPESSKSYGNTPYLELKPGERIPVKFTFQTPEDAPPGDHSLLLFFELFEFRKASEGAVSQVSGRLGSRIRMRVQGDMIENVDVRPFVVKSLVVGGTVPWSFSIRNDGNIDKALSSRVSMFDGNEEEVAASVVTTDTTVYANTVIQRRGVLEPSDLGLGFGRFTVKVAATYGREGQPNQPPMRIEKSRTVYLVPLWFIIALGAVAAILLVWGLWTLSVRSAGKRIAKARERELAGHRRVAHPDLPGADAPEDRPPFREIS